MSEAEDKSRVGKAVITVRSENTADDWSDEARLHCQWGVSGKIINYSNSHGLCYRVQHEDGTTAWYDMGELIFKQKISTWVIVGPGSDVDHTSICIEKEDCIKDFLDTQDMILTIAGKEDLPDWSHYQKQGYKCVRATLVVHG